MLMNECNDALIKNITLPASNSTTNNTSNSTQEVIIPAIVEEIGQLLCPNDCASNGKCVNGSCICNKDYTAEDCSISLYQVPDISRLVLRVCERENKSVDEFNICKTCPVMPDSLNSHPASWNSICYTRGKYIAKVASPSGATNWVSVFLKLFLVPCVKLQMDMLEK